MSTAFDLGTDPLTGRALMNEDVAIGFSRSTNEPIYPSSRQVVCLALNEVGRRAKFGFVYWTDPNQLGDLRADCPALFYVPHEWTAEDCKGYDEDTPGLRLRSARVSTLSAPTSSVLPVDLDWEVKIHVLPETNGKSESANYKLLHNEIRQCFHNESPPSTVRPEARS